MKPVFLSYNLQVSSLILAVTLFCKTDSVLSQPSNIVPDNTLGNENSQVIENAGDQPIEIITGGAQREQNLFHSFQEFNVSEGRGAYFNSPDVNIQNIFSRVTGGNPSEIMGVLGTFGESNPNLYLINPNGILFGENASLDVQGSFAATTASGIEFGEQGNFDTINPQIPQLLTIEPSAYLFNQIDNQKISGIESQADLEVFSGNRLILLGGNINLDDASIIARGGGIELGGLSKPGRVEINNNSLSFSGLLEKSNISINNSGIFSFVLPNAVGNAGNVIINSRNFEAVNGSQILTDTLSKGNAGDIIINASETTVFDGEFTNTQPTQVATVARENAEGNSGKIVITTGSLSVTNGALIDVSIDGFGDAGSIQINANKSVLFEGISSDNQPSGAFSVIEVGAIGNGGDIDITADSLFIKNGAELTASTRGFGDAGNILLNVEDNVVLDRGTIFSSVQPNAEGSGGNINIESKFLSLTNAELLVSTRGIGNAGNIFINNQDTVLLKGSDGGEVLSGILSRVNQRGIGDAGDISIITSNLTLSEKATISTSTFGKGDGGSIVIKARDQVSIDDSSFFSAVGRRIGDILAEGKGGDLNIMTNSIFITNNSVLSTSTLGNGDAGQINIESNIFSLENNSVIENSSVSFFDDKKAGDININILDTLEVNDSNIFSNSVLSSGAKIAITAKDILLIDNSNIGTNVSFGSGGGGDINLTADSIVAFDDSDIFAFAPDGQGGNITLNTPAFFAENFTLNSLTSDPDTLENNNRADINATGAVSGVVDIPDVSFIQNSLTELPDNSINTNELVANSCVSSVGNRQQGKFIITGGDSLPVRPGNADISAFATGEVRGVSEAKTGWQRGDEIVEPQGVYRLANGKLILSRECS